MSFRLGQMLRSIYADDASPAAVAGLSNTTLVASQINSTADGGGEGGVIFDSAVAMWQVSPALSTGSRFSGELIIILAVSPSTCRDSIRPI